MARFSTPCLVNGRETSSPQSVNRQFKKMTTKTMEQINAKDAARNWYELRTSQGKNLLIISCTFTTIPLSLREEADIPRRKLFAASVILKFISSKSDGTNDHDYKRKRRTKAVGSPPRDLRSSPQGRTGLPAEGMGSAQSRTHRRASCLTKQEHSSVRARPVFGGRSESFNLDRGLLSMLRVRRQAQRL